MTTIVQKANTKYRYRIQSTGYSSTRYDDCEVCGEPCTEVFYQIEESQYSGGWTQYDCHNLFGHEQCLLSQRR